MISHEEAVIRGKSTYKKREKAVCEVLRSAVLKANDSAGPLNTSVAAAAYASVPTKILILRVREKNTHGISVAQQKGLTQILLKPGVLKFVKVILSWERPSTLMMLMGSSPGEIYTHKGSRENSQ